MAFLARIDATGAQPATLAEAPRESQEPEFTPLEWSIVRLARSHDLSTIREPGRVRRFFAWLIGRNASRRLANDRLEALRRMAVLSRHFGFSISGEDVADFLSAGFTPEQYELLVTSVRAAARPQRRVVSGEVLA